MAIALFIVLALLVAVGIAFFAGSRDPLIGLGFALVTAVIGGSVIVGATHAEIRLLGGLLLFIAFAVAVAVLASGGRSRNEPRRTVVHAEDGEAG